MPLGETWVSPCSTRMSSNGTPSWSDTIWLQAVSCPWPCALEPVTTSTLPVGSIRIDACSQPPAAVGRATPSTRDGARPHISVKVEMPMPRRTESPREFRSACSAAQRVVVE